MRTVLPTLALCACGYNSHYPSRTWAMGGEMVDGTVVTDVPCGPVHEGEAVLVEVRNEAREGLVASRVDADCREWILGMVLDDQALPLSLGEGALLVVRDRLRLPVAVETVASPSPMEVVVRDAPDTGP